MIYFLIQGMLSYKEKKILKNKSISYIKPVNPVIKKSLVKLINVFGKLIFFYKKNRLPGNVKKILFISLYFNGDILFQSPLFEYIKKIYPEAEFSIWIKKRASGIIEGYPYFKKVYIYDNIRTRRFDEKVNQDIKGKFQFFKKLKAEKYDIIFDVTGLFWTAFSVFYSKPLYSAGFNYQGFDFVYNFSSEAVTTGHLIDRHLNLISKNPVFTDMYIDDEESAKPKFYISGNVNQMHQKYRDNNLDLSSPKIIFHLTAGWESKKWDIINFIELAKLLPVDFQIILVGSADDIKTGEKFVNSLKRKVINFIGKLTFSETGELMRISDLFIGSDSGPLYIAEAVGTKTISLFGPTNPLFSAPRGKEHTCIYNKLFCSAEDNEQNCILIAGLNCKTIDCMKMIKPDDVYKAVVAQLSIV